MVAGLTGGMGCGKSVAGRCFEEAGWGRVDTDEIVRELLRADRDVIDEVRQAFGAGSFDPNGGIDRRALGGIVFADAAALGVLEGILHPRVRAIWQVAVTDATRPHWVVEIPLLFEKGLEKEVDFTICVACDSTVQAERLASRGLSPQEASRRIARQLPLAQKIDRADFVLTNNGSLSFLREQVIRLMNQLIRSAV